MKCVMDRYGHCSGDAIVIEIRDDEGSISTGELWPLCAFHYSEYKDQPDFGVILVELGEP